MPSHPARASPGHDRFWISLGFPRRPLNSGAAPSRSWGWETELALELRHKNSRVSRLMTRLRTSTLACAKKPTATLTRACARANFDASSVAPTGLLILAGRAANQPQLCCLHLESELSLRALMICAEPIQSDPKTNIRGGPGYYPSCKWYNRRSSAGCNTQSERMWTPLPALTDKRLMEEVATNPYYSRRTLAQSRRPERLLSVDPVQFRLFYRRSVTSQAPGRCSRGSAGP